MTTAPDLSIILARMDVKLDAIIEKTGDHEARLRKLEAGRSWPVVLTNGLLTTLNAALASVVVVGG